MSHRHVSFHGASHTNVHRGRVYVSTVSTHLSKINCFEKKGATMSTYSRLQALKPYLPYSEIFGVYASRIFANLDCKTFAQIARCCNVSRERIRETMLGIERRIAHPAMRLEKLPERLRIFKGGKKRGRMRMTNFGSNPSGNFVTNGEAGKAVVHSIVNGRVLCFNMFPPAGYLRGNADFLTCQRCQFISNNAGRFTD